MIKRRIKKQLKKVLITFTSALLAFQNVVHSLMFVGEIDLSIIESTVEQIGNSFKTTDKTSGVVGYFRIDNVENIPVYFYTKAPDYLTDNVCVFSDSAGESVIDTLKQKKVYEGCVLYKLSEINTQIENIKELQKNTSARNNILPSNQKSGTNILTLISSVGLISAIVTIGARKFYDNKIHNQKNNAPKSEIQQKT